MTNEQFKTLDLRAPLLEALDLPPVVRSFLEREQVLKPYSVGSVLFDEAQQELVQLREEVQHLRAALASGAPAVEVAPNVPETESIMASSLGLSLEQYQEAMRKKPELIASLRASVRSARSNHRGAASKEDHVTE